MAAARREASAKCLIEALELRVTRCDCVRCSTIGFEALEKTVRHAEDGNWVPLQSYFDRRLPSIAGWLTVSGNPPESSGPTDYAGLRTSFGNIGGS